MSRDLRIVLLGPGGQIGWELTRALVAISTVLPLDRARADLRDTVALRAAVRRLQPDAIINAAAYTDVDGAENDRSTAFAVNATAPAALAEVAAAEHALLVHFSTDYVFDGSAHRPYTEQDPTSPLGVYGETKREGERAILETGADALIFRTSWVYGVRGRNFLSTIRRLARTGEPLRVVDDQVGAPTWSRAVAEAVASVLARIAYHDGFALPRAAGGIYHLTASGETSWHGFAREILERDPAIASSRPFTLQPIASHAFPRPARRPAYSVLDNGRIASAFGIRLPHWVHLLDLALAPNAEGPETPARG